jgi:hypothetical protein
MMDMAAAGRRIRLVCRGDQLLETVRVYNAGRLLLLGPSVLMVTRIGQPVKYAIFFEQRSASRPQIPAEKL